MASNKIEINFVTVPKVWEVTANAEDAVCLGSKYYVSNMKQQGETFSVRIVSDTLPAANAVKAAPNLEDVFLYHFGEKQ